MLNTIPWLTFWVLVTTALFIYGLALLLKSIRKRDWIDAGYYGTILTLLSFLIYILLFGTF